MHPEEQQSPQLVTYMPLMEFVKRLLVLGAFLIVALTLWQLRVVLMMGFLAVIIAISMDIPIRRLQDRGMRRSWAMLGVTISTVTFLILVGLIIGTPIVTQTQALFEELPQAIDQLGESYADLSQRHAWLPNAEFSSTSLENSDSLGIVKPDWWVTEGAAIITTISASVIGVVVNLVIVIIVAMYLLAEPETYANSFLSMIPKSHQVRMLKIMITLRESLVSWLVTQLIAMSIIGFLIAFSLGVIWGVPNPVALGLVAGLLTFIPNFGSIIAVIPAIIFTLVDKPAFILPVILTYVVVQQIESNFITPLIVKRRLAIPAAALLIFQVMMGVLFGFMGLLLAVPIFMVIRELVRELYVDDVLNNINTAIESRSNDVGQTVVRVKSKDFESNEIPLHRIFGANPFDETLDRVLKKDSEPE